MSIYAAGNRTMERPDMPKITDKLLEDIRCELEEQRYAYDHLVRRWVFGQYEAPVRVGDVEELIDGLLATDERRGLSKRKIRLGIQNRITERLSKHHA